MAAFVGKIPFLCAFIFIFSSCSFFSSKALYKIDGIAFSIPYHLLIFCEEEDIEKVEIAWQNLTIEAHTVWNVWNPDSELSRWNSSSSKEFVTISPLLTHLLKLSDQVVAETDGRFDPTVHTLKSYFENISILTPLPEGLKEAFGWKNIELKDFSLKKTHPLTQIDLNALGKGFLVDSLIGYMEELKIESAFFEWGGEIKAIGMHPEGRPWKIGIKNPIPGKEDSSLLLTTTPISIATSGDYHLYRELEDGTSICHIFNPLSETPLQISGRDYHSVTVLDINCWRADAWATALMTFENNASMFKWLKERKNGPQEVYTEITCPD